MTHAIYLMVKGTCTRYQSFENDFEMYPSRSWIDFCCSILGSKVSCLTIFVYIIFVTYVDKFPRKPFWNSKWNCAKTTFINIIPSVNYAKHVIRWLRKNLFLNGSRHVCCLPVFNKNQLFTNYICTRNAYF